MLCIPVTALEYSTGTAGCFERTNPMTGNYYRRLTVSVFLAFLFSLPITKPANATDVTILYSGDAQGEIEPCG